MSVMQDELVHATPIEPTAVTAMGGSEPDGELNAEKWTLLVRQIQAGEVGGMEELYRLFSKGVRFYLCRQLGSQELDDKLHDSFLVVVQAIRRGELREPERLMGFVRTIVRRQVASYIQTAVSARREQLDMEVSAAIVDAAQNPEESAIRRQKALLMQRVLAGMSVRDREVLTRFYIHEQSQEQICDEMGLSETQFRLLKSRAKSRFGEAGRRKLLQRSFADFFVRKK